MTFNHVPNPITAIAQQYPAIQLVYLFGARVTGSIGPMSDTDLAILFDHTASEPALRAELTQRLAETLHSDELDIVILNQAPIEFAYSVIAEGIALYQRSMLERIEYEAKIISQYCDYLPVLRAQSRTIIDGAGDERRIQRYRAAYRRTQRTLGTLASIMQLSKPTPVHRHTARGFDASMATRHYTFLK
ncbi:type VII toxin-antitoxin system MntA family adenylyltransferase antitoxin [Chloroflexus sp.]|uniref:type VII toxin-antitoxin system MntA family adenylyltransferase antitoxin n=1 Tax=Chloroflexus sp. TaxID=1904827 RepID=UPI002ACEE0FA|nr:nucleotidyltransferase domain-containing protein [Chloroflexus sp.]